MDRADFCIEIQFEKDSEEPARVFKTMVELINSLQELDMALAESVDVCIKPVLILEDIEYGSIKTWLRQVLIAIDDEAIKNIDWKPAVGKYLVQAKYLIIDFCNKRTTISSRDEIRQLELELYKAAKETDVKRFPGVYQPMQTKKLFGSMKKIWSSLDYLNEKDTATFVTKEKSVKMNAEFSLAPETIDDLLTETVLSGTSEMILKVKRPDYLGESMWDFRHGRKSVQAKILHKEWLQSFQGREIDIRPGDSIRATVKRSDRYDERQELVGTTYEIIKVDGVVPDYSGEQLSLPME